MQKKSIKILILVIALALMMTMLAGCGSASLKAPEAASEVQTYEITGTCEIAVNDGVVTVSGETNILSDARIHVSVHAQSGTELDGITITKQSGNDQISEDFVMDNDYDDAQSIIGYITLAPKEYGKQLDKIYDAYGDNFEYVETADENEIYNRNGNVVLFASEPMNLK